MRRGAAMSSSTCVSEDGRESIASSHWRRQSDQKQGIMESGKRDRKVKTRVAEWRTGLPGIYMGARTF
jgi:hypothetical protein